MAVRVCAGRVAFSLPARGVVPLVLKSRLLSSAMSEEGEGAWQYETLTVSRPRPWVVQVTINRPQKSNAMNRAFFREVYQCFQKLSSDSDCRSVVLCGNGKHFTAGLDLPEFARDFMEFSGPGEVARRAVMIRAFLKPMQESFSAVEKCPKPVIAAVHSACVGAGVDLVTACDIRLCSSDAWFQVKEVDIGVAADLGTLQRLPRVVGSDSVARELVYTARKLPSDEALRIGLVSQVYADKETTEEAALALAEEIATKSPVAVQGSKVNLNYSRDHSVDEALEYMVAWSSAMLQTEDIPKAVQAFFQKEKPVFSKL